MGIIKKIIGLILRGITKIVLIFIFYLLIFGANVLLVLAFDIEAVDAMSEQNRNLYFALPAIFGGIYIARRIYRKFTLASKINTLVGIAVNSAESSQTNA